jgi:hypothetical protein
MQEAIRELFNDERVKVNERIVAISGSPLAMRGATSTVRLYQISENGEILGVE